MSDRVFLTFKEAVRHGLGDIEGLDAIDLGSGSGGKTRALASLGAVATGLEPQQSAVDQARERGGGPAYVMGSADAAPFGDAAFDLAVFTYSLHHCPDPVAALREAVRVVRPGGRIAVFEPEADDPIYPVAKLIDDEKMVYDLAQSAIAQVSNEAGLDRADPVRYATRYRVSTAEALIDGMVSVDPNRKRPDALTFKTLFDAALERDEDGVFIPCWERLDVLRKAA
ncbi:MAG: class I SAM-dependent methyltransferase [Pseudomonadota bacterium]